MARAPAIVAPAKVEPVATPVLIPVWPAATEVGTEPVVKQEK
ncbi:MAG: hypothetical protein NTY70_08355 [Burkholderiales bacterium]|nr:hypothetical protein [Burkholderiales bacterium]